MNIEIIVNSATENGIFRLFLNGIRWSYKKSSFKEYRPTYLYIIPIIHMISIKKEI